MATAIIHTVTTVAALTAVPKASLVDGDQIQVAGYYAAGDKEAVTYVWDAASTATANGGTVFAHDSGGDGRFLLQRNVISVSDFGAVGDDPGDGTGTPDTVAIQAAADSGGAKLVFVAGGIYRITDTLTFPANMNVDFNGAQILYNGTRDRPAVVFGQSGVGNTAIIEKVNVRSNTVDWSNNGFIGVRVINASRCFISIDAIRGFTINYEALSQGDGYVYNTHVLGSILSSKYGMVFTSDGVLEDSGEYVNENTFFGGNFANLGDSPNDSDCYNIWFRSINSGYRSNNNNKFYGPSFEPGDGDSGYERIPIFMDNCGSSNQFLNVRHESGRGVTMRCDGATWGVRNNYVSVQVGTGANVTLSIDQNGVARANILENLQKPHTGASFSVGDMVKKVLAYSSTEAMVLGPLHFSTNSSTAVMNVASTGGAIKPRRHSVEIAGSRAIGFYCSVEEGDSFLLYSRVETGSANGLVGVNALNSSMTVLTSGDSGHPHILDYNPLTDVPNRYNANFGGCYYVGTSTNVMRFTVNAGVSAIRCFAAGVCYLQGISLVRLNNTEKPLNIFSGLNNQDGVHYAGANWQSGIVGVYARGHTAFNAVASGGGATPLCWPATSAGRLAPAWVAATAYVVGDLVLNDSGTRVYECATAGTSAGSGGPTGTGAGISDGTCVWDFVSMRPNVGNGPVIQ